MTYNEIGQTFDKVYAIEKGADAQEVFQTIANELFTNFCIKQGEDVTYKFLEVEFYYHSPKHKDDKEKDGKMETFVYRRNADRHGVFFLHDSGVDMCFANKGESYGGILIRSLLRIEKGRKEMVVTGPWDCCDALFNYTDGERFPIIQRMDEPLETVKPKATRRYNADKANAVMADELYCFYDDRFVFGNDWGNGFEIYERYDATTKGVKSKYNAKPWGR